MTHALSSQQRVGHAENLAEVLDAAYLTFGEMLTVIRRCEDSGAPFHAALVMAAVVVADGRDAVAGAPSFRPGSRDQTDIPVASARPAEAAAYVASLSQAVAAALRQAAAMPSALADREACHHGARYANEAHSLASGDWP